MTPPYSQGLQRVSSEGQDGRGTPKKLGGPKKEEENIKVNATNPKSKDRLMSLREAAFRLGVSHLTLKGWVEDRKVNSHKLGARRLIAESEIERLIKESLTPRKRELDMH